FVRLPDGFATGSSMMPQKRNADVAELARGRTGKVYGELIGILTTLKGLPLAYNRDLQEDKASVQAAAGIVLPTIEIFAAMLPALEFNLDRMRTAAGESFSLATDVADYLVKKGMPFREAHGVVGGLVRECEERRCALNQLPLDVYDAASPLFEADILALDVDAALAARDIPGGTAPNRVREAAEALRRDLA
ncbi:MAG: argininosuccinate lyase, partial [Dehalococcoidia bacterium]